MQAQLSNFMHQILTGYIGEEVSCTVLENGEIVEYRGTLNQVLPFNGVQIDDDFIPFQSGESVIMGGNAIREIIHLSSSTILYFNQDTLGCSKEERVEIDSYKSK